MPETFTTKELLDAAEAKGPTHVVALARLLRAIREERARRAKESGS